MGGITKMDPILDSSFTQTRRKLDSSGLSPQQTSFESQAGEMRLRMLKGKSADRPISITAATPARNCYGLTLVHEPLEATADLVFVHGLGGSSWNTWCWRHDPTLFWPAWLQHERGLSQFRVFTFGYNANWRGPDTSLSILDFAKGLLVRMRGYGHETSETEKPLGRRPIIFVAHSMGGLVVKKAYVLGKYDEHYARLISRVHGIVFLSTPHRGSSHASTLSKLLSIMVGTFNKVYISELGSNSPSIQDLNEQFRAVCGPLRLASMYETLPTKVFPAIKKMIVGKDTGIMNYPKEISGPADADHHTICKYRSRVDDNYILFITFLKQISQDLAYSPRAPVKQPSPVDRARTLKSILGIVDSPLDDLEKHTSRRLQGSGDWLRERESFKHWLSDSSGETRLLCLSGMPGTGKSTLAAITIRHLQHVSSNQSCQYHFFTESQPTKQSLAYCLRSIAFQVANTHDTVAERLLRLHQDVGDVLSSQRHQTIWAKVFEGILLKLDVGYTLHWVIDAVDEAESPQAFAKLLSQMRPSSCIKVMLLSRPDKDIASALAQRGKAAVFDAITARDTAEDIRGYVRSVVTETLPKESHIQNEVIQQILSRTEGSFLWARLALDTLQHNWHTLGDIQKAMDIIPQDMQSLYRTMLLTVRNQEPRLQDIARRILTWAACSFRSMKVAELQAALEPDFGRFVSLEDTIVQICGHFVRVDGDSVSLIHATARRFLIPPSGSEPELVSAQLGHEILAKTCLRYLSDDNWRRILSNVSEAETGRKDGWAALCDSHPLLSYAMNYWAYHVRHAPVDSPGLLQHLKLFFSKHVLCWIQAVALSRSLRTLPLASQYIKLYLKRRKKARAISLNSETSLGVTAAETEVQFLERWSVDLIRLLGKFGSNLAETPSSIFKHIPPFCPRESILAQYGAEHKSPLVKVTGISQRTWDDNLARLSVGQEDTVSKVRCSGVYLFTLISSTGTIIVWSAETCEELRRLEHGEWVVLFETNATGSMVVSSGRFSFKVWDISTGQLLHVFPKGLQLWPTHLAFGMADTDLVVAYDDCSVRWYEFETGKEVKQFATDQSNKLRGCPRLMVLSPGQSQVAIAFRGRPVFVWDIVTGASSNPPRRCLRACDKARSNDSDAYSAPEAAVWHPEGDSLFILYQDTVIVRWDLVEDERSEYDQAEAREVVINSDGTLLLTSNFSGVLSVWALPRFNLIYRLHGNDSFVRDMAFSPSSHRIYEARGSICCVWEPDALVRPDDIDRHGDNPLSSTAADGSLLPEAAPQTVISQDAGGSKITALAYESGGEFYCCGRDDGTVAIHDLLRGRIARKVCAHGARVDIVVLAWSHSGRFLVSGDDMGKVIAKKLRLKEDGKWAVFPVFETRIADTSANQLLFSPDEALLLVSAPSRYQVWELATKTMMLEKIRSEELSGQWINHPLDENRLLFVEQHKVHIYNWRDFNNIMAVYTIAATDPTDRMGEATPRSGEASAVAKVHPLLSTDNRRFLVRQTSPEPRTTRSGTNRDGCRLSLLLVTDLQTPPLTPQDRIACRLLPDISTHIQCFLGCYREKLVFINHENWLCTSNISREDKAPLRISRHFFLPRDWLGTESTIRLSRFTEHGVLLVPRNAEVAIVRYGSGF